MNEILSEPTLILNRNWQPVGVAPVARALVLVWKDTARVVEPGDYQTFSWDQWLELSADESERALRAGWRRLRVPEVVVLTAYDQVPKTLVSFCRRNIFKRDRYTCQYCGVQPRRSDWTLDHVVPRAQGGESRWDNCVLACSDCNRRKADRTPQQARMRLRRLPEQPRWNPQYSLQARRRLSWKAFV